MKKINVSILLSSLFLASSINAQKNYWDIKYSSFVKSDYRLDNRQTVALLGGHFLLFPANEQLDVEGTDINAVTNVASTTIIETYLNINTLSFWTKYVYGKDLQYELFFGYSKNSGTDIIITD